MEGTAQGGGGVRNEQTRKMMAQFRGHGESAPHPGGLFQPWSFHDSTKIMKELFQGWLSQWSDCTLSTSPRENRRLHVHLELSQISEGQCAAASKLSQVHKAMSWAPTLPCQCLKGPGGRAEHSRMWKPWKVPAVTVCSSHPTAQHFWAYTNTNPWRDNAAAKTHSNNPFVCPSLHFPPRKKPTKINYCITFYFILFCTRTRPTKYRITVLSPLLWDSNLHLFSLSFHFLDNIPNKCNMLRKSDTE